MNQAEVKRAPTAWQERIKNADGDAESIWRNLIRYGEKEPPNQVAAACLLVVAAELRAARIAQRPAIGDAGVSENHD